MVAQQIINKPERVEKVSLDSLEKACLAFFNSIFKDDEKSRVFVFLKFTHPFSQSELSKKK
jgi:hypothetical protein